MVQIRPTKVGLPEFWNPINGSWWMVQIQPSQLEGPMTLNLFCMRRFVSKAGSEQSTNFRWWDSQCSEAVSL
jgi:hypothetical protein